MFWQQRRVPSAQDDGEVRIPLLDGASNFNRFPDHRSGHKRDTKAECITYFFENALLIVWSDGGIDEADLVPSTLQRRCDRQNTQRRRRIGAGKRRKEKNNFAGLGQRISPRLRKTIDTPQNAVVTGMSAICQVSAATAGEDRTSGRPAGSWLHCAAGVGRGYGRRRVEKGFGKMCALSALSALSRRPGPEAADG